MKSFGALPSWIEQESMQLAVQTDDYSLLGEY